MFLPPLPLALAHALAVDGIGSEFLAVIRGAPLALAGRLATDKLLGTIDGWGKQTMAMRTAPRSAQPDSSERQDESLRRIETHIKGKI